MNFKLNYLRLPIIIGVSLMILFGCNHIQEDLIDPVYQEVGYEGVHLKNGRLVFQDRSTIAKYLDELLDLTKDGRLDDWERKFSENGYVSMRSAYGKITQEDYDEMGNTGSLDGVESLFAFVLDENMEYTLEKVAMVPAKATILNENGIVQIGDSVYKFTYDKVIRVKYSTESSIKSLVEVKDGRFPIDATIIPIITIPVSDISRAVDDCCENIYDPYGTKKRKLIGKIKYKNDNILVGLHCHTRHKKKGVFGYSLSATYRLDLDLQGEYQYIACSGCGYTVEDVDFQVSENNVSEIFQFVGESVSEVYSGLSFDVDGDHECLCDSQITKQCTTRSGL